MKFGFADWLKLVEDLCKLPTDNGSIGILKANQ